MSLNYLGSLIGTEVKINRGGPDSIAGRILSVHHDYLVVRMNDGTIVYIQLQHIKSISGSNASRGNKSNSSNGSNKSNSSNGSNKSNKSNKSNRSGRTLNRFEHAYTFEGLLNQMRYTFVQINRGGPEKIEGLVVHSGDNVLLLVVNNEIIRIPIFHIKSISINAVNKNSSKSNNSNSSSNKNNDKSNDNKKSNNNKSNKATASQIVAIKLLLKKYRAL